MSTVALIPAAGASARLGQPKQLVTFRGVPLVQRAVNIALAAGCERVIVVTGALPLALHRAQTVHTADWQRGPGASLRAGAMALASHEAALVLLGDQWALEAASLRALLEAPGPVAAARYAGTLGVPVRFDAAHVKTVLRSLPDAHGAQAWLRQHPTQVTPVDLPEAALDLDTPQALESLRDAERR